MVWIILNSILLKNIVTNKFINTLFFRVLLIEYTQEDRSQKITRRNIMQTKVKAFLEDNPEYCEELKKQVLHELSDSPVEESIDTIIEEDVQKEE